MQSITLDVILSEIKRIELVHSGEFKSLREEIGGIKTEIVKMNTRLGRVEEGVEVIRKHTAILTEGQMERERRLRQLERSNA